MVIIRIFDILLNDRNEVKISGINDFLTFPQRLIVRMKGNKATGHTGNEAQRLQKKNEAKRQKKATA
jgi:hypothetical protein